METRLTEAEIEDFREAFGLFDRQGKGGIGIHELRTVLMSLGKNPSEEELRDMIKEVDEDGSGEIEFDEFLKMMVRRMKAPDNQSELIDALRVFDQGNNGFISLQQLEHVLTNVGETLSDKEMDALLKAADPHGYGQVNYVEFVKLMSE